MLYYLLKRILLALPSLWLIATFIFLLSRLLPGAFGAEAILKESGGFYSSGQSAARQAAYITFLQRTGQLLPPFYISIRSAAEPDTMYSVLPEHERMFLKRLAWTYGDKNLAAAYFDNIKELEQVLSSKSNKHQNLLDKLYSSTAPEEIIANIDSLEYEITGVAGANVTKLRNSAIALKQKTNPYKAFIPAFYWHGSQNQYHRWLINLLQGDWGNSFRDNRPVLSVLAEAIQATFLIFLLSMLITAILALELSLFMLKQKRSTFRKIILPLLFLTDRIPVFLLALLLLIFFASPDYLQLFPVFGLGYYVSIETNWIHKLYLMAPYMALPIACLVLVNLPYLTTQFYRALADVSQAEFVKTAKAKGLSEGAILRRHILRNALLPIITLLSDFVPALVAGAVVVETIFAIPGMGSLLVNAVQARDYPVIVGVVLVVAIAKVITHLVADLLYSLADPRIRFAST